MAIYNRCGAPVRIIAAEKRDVTVRVGRRRETVSGVWFVKVETTGLYPDGSGTIGKADREWRQAGAELQADSGWSEIVAACEEAA